MTADTRGHCCWPGQVWLASASRCAGAPRCPAGFEQLGELCLARCEAGEMRVGLDCRCVPGRVRNADTRDHCCWPGQYWSETDARCGGLPECPFGMVVRGEDCRPPS